MSINYANYYNAVKFSDNFFDIGLVLDAVRVVIWVPDDVERYNICSWINVMHIEPKFDRFVYSLLVDNTLEIRGM